MIVLLEWALAYLLQKHQSVVDSKYRYEQIYWKKLATLFHKKDVMNAACKWAKREVGRKLDMFRLCIICKTPSFSYRSLIIYVQHFEIFYLALCSIIASKTDWGVKMAAKLFLSFIHLGKINENQWPIRTVRKTPIIEHWPTVILCKLPDLHGLSVDECLACGYFWHPPELY